MYVIQIILPDSVAEKRSLELKASQGALPITRIEHLSGNEYASELSVDDTEYAQKYGFHLSNDEILNFLSHRKAWQEFLKSGTEWCLITESNVSLNVDFNEILGTVEELPEMWDIFIPYDAEAFHENRLKVKNGETLINRNNWEINNYEPYLMGYKYGNSVYFLSRAGAAKLMAIDMIYDRLDHTIMTMTEEKNVLNVYSAEVDWISMDNIHDYNWPGRGRSILEGALRQSTWNELRLKRARKLLKTLSDIAAEINIDLTLEAGTLLGHIRHGSIMPWDDDVDVGIELKNLELFFSKVEEHKNLRWSGDFLFYGTRFFKVWDIGGEEMEGFPQTFPFIDVWAYNLEGDDLVFENGIRYPGTAKEGFEEVDFEGSRYKVPSNSLAALDSRFTDWRNMIRVYSYCHRLKNFSFKYLCIPIKTDEKGRMLPLE